nr:hypothetical protein [Acidiphilium multivorum]
MIAGRHPVARRRGQTGGIECGVDQPRYCPTAGCVHGRRKCVDALYQFSFQLYADRPLSHEQNIADFAVFSINIVLVTDVSL